MKKSLSIILSLLMIISALSVMPMSAFADLPDITDIDIPDIGGLGFSESGSCGANVSYVFDSSTGKLTISGTGKMTDYNASSFISNMGISPFNGQTQIKSVEIKSGVTSVGSNTFALCTEITSVSLANSITSIGERAFASCTGITEISIPSGMRSIGKYVFLYCSGLQSVYIPVSVKSIEDWAFFGCDDLKIVYFLGTKQEWKNVSVGAHNDSITNAAVICKDGNTEEDEPQLTTGKCGENVSYSFNKSSRVLTISGTGNMADADSPFATSTKIKAVVIESGVSSIGKGAFSDCTALESVTIPTSVKNINESAFSHCSELKEVNYYGTEANWKAINIKNDNEALTSAKINYEYNKTTPVSIPCLVHYWQDEAVIAPATCTTEGRKRVKCKNCGLIDYQAIPALGHVLDSGRVIIAPTTEDEGLKIYSCTVCKTVLYKQDIPKLLVNKMKVRGKKVLFRYSAVKVKSQSVAQRKAIEIRDAQGTLTYKKLKGNKNIKINKKTGKVTVKKGLKKGTYSIKVKVRASGNEDYAPASKKVTLKVIIK